jgi:hypothetical protein
MIFIDRFTNIYYLLKNLSSIIHVFSVIFFSNVIIEGFIDKKARQTKKYYLLYFINISISEYDISLTRKTYL